MSTEFWFRGAITFADQAAIDAAMHDLREGEYFGSEDNLVTTEDLKWDGLTLRVDMRGSMPSSCFAISSSFLGVLAGHAAAGDLVLLDVENGFGERHPGGGDSDELEDDEVEELRAEYGWQEEEE